jgi:hypothetical protein
MTTDNVSPLVSPGSQTMKKQKKKKKSVNEKKTFIMAVRLNGGAHRKKTFIMAVRLNGGAHQKKENLHHGSQN